MKKNIVLLFAILTLNSSYTDKKINLTGLWQDAPNVAAGFTNTYQFFSNGTFKFNYDEMNCAKRTIALIGNWKIKKSGNLMLIIKQKIIHEGGKLVPSEGSCGSDYQIEGGKIKTIILDRSEIKILKLTDFKIDINHENVQTIKIDGIKYWKIAESPYAYQ